MSVSQADIALVVGIVATAVSFTLVIPQIVRLLRTGETAGVSVAWCSAGVVVNLAWISYVIAEQVWIAIPSVAVATISFAIALFLLYRNGAAVSAGLLYSLMIAVACVAVQRSAGWTVLGTVLGLGTAVHFGPSVVAAWRSHTPVGVSPLTWSLAECEGLFWALYGILVATGPIIVFGVTEALVSALVLLRLWVARHRIRAAIAAPG